MPKQKADGYLENSQEFELPYLAVRRKAQEFISEKSLEAAETIYQTMKDPEEPKLRLDAAKEILKVNGFYVEKVEHSGKVEFEPHIISREAE